jgi:hypothetical protein
MLKLKPGLIFLFCLFSVTNCGIGNKKCVTDADCPPETSTSDYPVAVTYKCSEKPRNFTKLVWETREKWIDGHQVIVTEESLKGDPDRSYKVCECYMFDGKKATLKWFDDMHLGLDSSGNRECGLAGHQKCLDTGKNPKGLVGRGCASRECNDRGKNKGKCVDVSGEFIHHEGDRSAK